MDNFSTATNLTGCYAPSLMLMIVALLTLNCAARRLTLAPPPRAILMFFLSAGVVLAGLPMCVPAALALACPA
jgi:hypothetical protein